jgi:hypothetical protein
VADTGWVDVGTGVYDTSYGTTAWVSPEQITADDGSNAQIISVGAVTSYYLKGTNVGLSIPAEATIDGIEVRLEGRKSNAVTQTIDRIRLVDEAGTIGTTDRSAGETFTTSDVFYPFGGASDLWEDTWSETDVEDIDFGFVLAVVKGANFAQCFIDVFQVKVYYTEDGGPPPIISLVMAPHTPT